LFSRFVQAAAFALALGLVVAVPAYAMEAMAATPACTSDALHAAMASTAKKLESLQLPGTPDRDYAEAINSVMESEHTLNAWETKCGKNAKLMKMAGDMQKSLGSMQDQLAHLNLGG
jgi:hypothetical protein